VKGCGEEVENGGDRKRVVGIFLGPATRNQYAASICAELITNSDERTKKFAELAENQLHLGVKEDGSDGTPATVLALTVRVDG